MNLRIVYFLLCVLGALLPLSQFIPWVLANGANIPLFFQELFSNKIGAFFGMDVFVSAVVLFVFIIAESKKIKMKNIWLPIVATLTVGVSLGFPLFLYMRQCKIDGNKVELL